MNLRLFTPGPEDGDGVQKSDHNPDDPTIRWVVDLFLDHDKSAAASRTHEDRVRVLGLFCEQYGDYRVSNCKPAHLELWLNARAQIWLSSWTMQRACLTVQRPFNWAHKLGLISCNPFFGVSRRPGEPGRSTEDWEFQRLLRRTNALFRRVLIFLRFTGCRPGEMSAIEWEHIDTDRGLIVLQRHKTRKTQRQPKPRIIVLHPVAVKLLAWLYRHRAAGQKYVFVNRCGRPWTRTSLALRISKLRKKCQVAKDCKLYGLRHGFATRAVENGVELKTLAELLGHTTTRMTEHYIHLSGRTKHLHGAILRAIGGAEQPREKPAT